MQFQCARGPALSATYYQGHETLNPLKGRPDTTRTPTRNTRTRNTRTRERRRPRATPRIATQIGRRPAQSSTRRPTAPPPPPPPGPVRWLWSWWRVLPGPSAARAARGLTSPAEASTSDGARLPPRSTPCMIRISKLQWSEQARPSSSSIAIVVPVPGDFVYFLLFSGFGYFRASVFELL
jgi:hypothetical protein